MMSSLPTSTYFHGHPDSDLNYVSRTDDGITLKERKHFIIQEREVSYRFYSHFHPYVKQLVQRLLREGTSGLQAADTEYASGEISLPFGVDFQLEDSVDSSIPSGVRIGLLSNVVAADSAGVPVELAKGNEFKLAEKTQARFFAGTRAMFVDAMESTPHPRTKLSLPTKRTAILPSDTLIRVIGTAQLNLADGTTVSIPPATEVLLAARTPFEVSHGTEVMVLRRRMRPKELYSEFFEAYGPTALVQQPYPVKDLDFTFSGAYAVYNWELFFHVPFTIAVHLSKNQRFAEAQHWFHYLFDPTDSGDGPTSERFWKVRPFQTTDVKKIEEVLVNLTTGNDPVLLNETIQSISAWKDQPFHPHVIARYRQQAYMYRTVMAYLDNLIAWGDSLFRQDTGEAIDEALMLYVLAANILGPRPQPVPKKGSVCPQTYSNLRKDLQQFGTAIREVEADAPFDLMPFPTETSGDNERLATVRSLGKALYFCVPRNDKLLSYWDIIADRLFKIRNSLNFQGVFRQLALFEPPIDPAMLARAAAAGLDVAAIVNGLNQPLPLVRFQLLVQKAAEIVQEVKSLGNNLLSAMEKEDGEAMAILRAKHERIVMGMVEHVKYGQWQEAIKSKEGLLQSLALAVQRYTYYERQLGKNSDTIKKAIPELEELDKDSLNEMSFNTEETDVGFRDIEVDIASGTFDTTVGAMWSGGKLLSSHEVQETLLLEAAQISTDVANLLNIVSSASHYVPEFQINVQPMGAGGSTVFGGKNVGDAVGATAAAAKAVADRLNFEARRAKRIDSFARREREWAFQSNLAAGEINQIFKQLRAAQIREVLAERELENHRQQIKHAQEIEYFLTGEKNSDWTQKMDSTEKKTTNKAFYTWIKREVKGLYAQCFQFAFDIAKKAERALQHELGNPKLSYLQFGYLAGKEGLLAGEKLYLDLKRMEMAYHDLNQREYELTKHVSLLQADPMALIQLRNTGRCTVRLPEALFDMDGPGHYFRRIKSVALSIPCVTGPYASVNCTLTLLKSSIRKTQILRDGAYARTDAEDDRFSDHFGSLQSIVTSSAQNDSGLFETNLRDERYLPFENSGVISEWQLQLPADPSKDEPCQFDYETISDVVFHIRYTAREGGGLLRQGALENVTELINSAEASGSVRLFSIRHEFPSEWAKFQSKKPTANERYELALKLRSEHYPFWSQRRLKSVKQVNILCRSTQNPSPGSLGIADKLDKNDGSAKTDALAKDANLGDLLVGNLSKLGLPAKPDQEMKIFFETNAISDLWVAVMWGN
jgi:hypothetical protein